MLTAVHHANVRQGAIMKRSIERSVLRVSLFIVSLQILIATFVAPVQLSHAKTATGLKRNASESPIQHAALAPIEIAVDATDAPRKILHARLTIPVKPGPLTLFYPKWIPGEHGPTGPITDLAGLKFTVAGKTVAWRRDDVDMFAFHLEAPPGATALETSLDFLLPASAEGFSSAASSTANLAVISWNQLLLYPQGYGSDDLTYTATLRLPDGWKYGTALPLETVATTRRLAVIRFKPVSLTTLVDSPVIAGAHFRALLLTDADVRAKMTALPGGAPVPSFEIDMASDSEAALQMSAEQIAEYKQLVLEANALFGGHHYEHYHFLYTLSDYVAHFGLEHHESSDDRVPERTLIDDALKKSSADLLPHEFVHSWNGKYRRPAGLTTPDYQQPMKGELLWVYEGLTEYLGSILSARTGLRTSDEQREHLAGIAAYLDRYPGRTWRPLIDTTMAAQLLYNASGAWAAWRRGVDFYDEGELIWLEADTIIREQTKGARSLDDFCRRFHGAPSGAPMVKPYTFDDVVNGLNEVAPYDWRKFFSTRLNSTEPHAPFGGITNGGWRLIYTEVQSEYQKAIEQARKTADLSYSIGVSLKEDGTINDIVPGTPAYAAGMGPGMKIVSVNGRSYEIDRLHEALREGKTSREPLELVVENGDFSKVYRLDYHDGARYPHLERDSSRPDLLAQILKPLVARR
jgi:predicted metalloprotease with PDZ domain